MSASISTLEEPQSFITETTLPPLKRGLNTPEDRARRFRPAVPVEPQLAPELASVDWRLNRLRAVESRIVDAQFRLEQAAGEIQQFLIRTRRTLHVTLETLHKSLPRHVRTQIPNIHNDFDPETDPPPNPVGLRPNPASGTTEPEIPLCRFPPAPSSGDTWSAAGAQCVPPTKILSTSQFTREILLFHPQSICHALLPSLAATPGRLWLLSTPNGQSRFCFYSWHKGSDWTRFHTNAADCRRIPPDFIRAAPRRYPERVTLNKRIIVAIDGPAAAGKGEAAKRLAARLGFLHIDTGAMYRAVALWALRSAIAFDDQHRVGALAEHASIRLTENRRVLLNGEDITASIRTPEIDQGASKVSAIPAVRRALVAEQRKMAQDASIVMEGRDIGTVVFPEAQVKFFLDAAPGERARRRQNQQLVEKGLHLEFDAVLQEIRERDLRDSSRSDSPLRQAEDAIVVDTTNLSPDEVEEELLRLVRERTSNGKEVTR